jgi:putative membrane protein insertion efficiency factor
MKKILVFIIELYQKFISPFLPNSCRFYPTCSNYAKEAIIKYGSIKGSIKALIRLSKCHPWHPGGIDKLK